MNTLRLQPAATLAAFLLALLLPALAAADALLVRTLDPATGGPLAGTYVQVGPAPGVPFAANSGLTGASGTISFSDPALSGPQVVTAGTADRAYVTITAAPEVEVTLHLPRRAAPDTLPDLVARVTGRGLNIATQSNDGRFDIGFVLPALDLDLLLGSGAPPFESPPDTAYFPAPIGTTEVPGIMTMPAQVELLFLTFQKPVYKIDLADNTTQSLFCLSGRIAIADLTSLGGNNIFALMNAFEMREVGIERNRSITNGAVIDVNVDHNLSRTLTVSFAGVPPGNDITAAAAARIPGPGGRDLYVLYDGKNALADQASSLSLSALNPAGDLADAVNSCIATWGDSSAGGPDYLSGIVKRDGYAIPTTLAMNSFMRVPAVTQDNLRFTFTDATNPGVSPSPTWSQSAIVLTASPGASGVSTTTHWLVFAPAPDLGFSLPLLAPAAPPALPDPASTPEDDRLRLDLQVNNQSGAAQAVLDDPFGDATHFSTRAIDVQMPAAAIPGGAAGEAPAARAALGRAYPDPFGAGGLPVMLPVAAGMDGPITLLIYAADGRAVRRLTRSALAGQTIALGWDGRDDRGRPVPSGAYLVRIDGVEGAREKVVLLR